MTKTFSIKEKKTRVYNNKQQALLLFVFFSFFHIVNIKTIELNWIVLVTFVTLLCCCRRYCLFDDRRNKKMRTENSMNQKGDWNTINTHICMYLYIAREHLLVNKTRYETLK